MRQTTQTALDDLAPLDAFTAQEAKGAGLSPRTLYRLCDEGEVIRLSRGVYQVAEALSGANPEYAAIAKRIPDGVLCLLSALYHHGLTTEIPREIHVAVHRNANVPRIDYPAVRIFRMSSRPFSVGVERKEVGGVPLRVFSAEKTIADCFKFRGLFGLDVAIEALKTYLARGRAKPSLLLEMARHCRVQTVIRPYLEALL
jgi:predicted transcriptional regulator of viral defense system